jgi:Domain of unknown function (DUF5664)
MAAIELDDWTHKCPVTGTLVTVSRNNIYGGKCVICGTPCPGPARDVAQVVMKYDANKPPVDLLDPGWLLGVARVLGKGAIKYAPGRWKKGMATAKVLAAALRHLLARIGGEKLDACDTTCPQDCQNHTNLPHLDCAACEIMFAAYYDRNSIDVPDDRFKADK